MGIEVQSALVLRILKIQAGAVQECNEASPEAALRAEDVIMSAIGVSGRARRPFFKRDGLR